MQLVRYCIRVAGWLVLLFALYEVLCRFLINDTPSIKIDRRYGPITEANHVQLQSNEGWAKNRTNELGNVDAPMPKILPPDAILVLGDSLTQGDQVAMRERYTDRAGTLLHRRVYNAGHGSWSLVNHVAFLEHELDRYRPETILVQVSGNDVTEMWKRGQAHLKETNGAFTIAVPYAKNSRLHDLVMTRSAFIRRFVQRARSVLLGKGDANDTVTDGRVPPANAERGLAFLMTELRQRHRDIAILYFPTLDYHAGCTDTWRTARDLFERTARDARLPFIDTTAALCAAFVRTRQPGHGFWNTVPGEGHLNTSGHAVVAEVLAMWIRTRGAPP